MRHLCRRHALGLLAVGGAALLLGGCGEEETGPVDVHWDRDSCELCRMIISDPRFTAQVRGGPKHKPYKFDDIGCAINWLNDKPWASDPKTEIWVAERTSTRTELKWLNARDARYLNGEMTPMNYGFGAVAADDPSARSKSYSFEQVADKILENTPNHICRPSGAKPIG